MPCGWGWQLQPMLSSTNLWVHFSRWRAHSSHHFPLSHLPIHFIFLINLRTYNLDLIDRTELSLPFDKYVQCMRCKGDIRCVFGQMYNIQRTHQHEKSIHVNTVDGWKWKKSTEKQNQPSSHSATDYSVLKYSKVDINICARLIHGTCKLYARHIDIGIFLLHSIYQHNPTINHNQIYRFPIIKMSPSIKIEDEWCRDISDREL